MTKAVIGVIGNAHLVENRYAAQLVGTGNMKAVADVADALPLMFAGSPEITDIADLMDAVDGILLTGARANVHPTRFGLEPHPGHEPYDEDRDAVALPLIQACVARGMPIFGICRGFQEFNVAFGGSLHPEIRDLPGRMNHRMPRLENGDVHPDLHVIFADRHDVQLIPDGAFSRLLGQDRIRVNSLHGQGTARPGRPRHCGGRRGGWNDGGDQDRRCARLRSRGAMARGARPSDQPREPGALQSVRPSRRDVQALTGAPRPSDARSLTVPWPVRRGMMPSRSRHETVRRTCSPTLRRSQLAREGSRRRPVPAPRPAARTRSSK